MVAEDYAVLADQTKEAATCTWHPGRPDGEDSGRRAFSLLGGSDRSRDCKVRKRVRSSNASGGCHRPALPLTDVGLYNLGLKRGRVALADGTPGHKLTFAPDADAISSPLGPAAAQYLRNYLRNAVRSSKRLMDADRLRQIERLFHIALEQPAEQRAAFIRGCCADDAELAREVESLLARDGATVGFLDRPAWEGAASLLESLPDLDMSPGGQLGPYRITRLVGSGGMGKVYEAYDTRLRRTVALKVAKNQFDERSGREARAIAALNHPNICTIYDVGANYLVMEYLEARPRVVRSRPTRRWPSRGNSRMRWKPHTRRESSTGT
jgi:hypothetical protein